MTSTKNLIAHKPPQPPQNQYQNQNLANQAAKIPIRMRVIGSSSIPHNEKHQIVKKSYKLIAPARPPPTHTKK
jgi:hypothetical protein